MKSPKHSFQTDRRNFFKKAALLGTAGVAGIFSRRFTRTTRPESVPERTPSRGYRLTAHIRKYYESAAS